MFNIFKAFWKNEVRFEKKLTTDELGQVRNQIKELQQKGKISSKIIAALQEKFPAKLGEQWEAERAYWTEVKRLEMDKIKDDAESLGLKKFRIQPNTGACDICLKFSQNGSKIFTESQLTVKGRPVPPVHPQCFCLLLPVVD